MLTVEASASVRQVSVGRSELESRALLGGISNTKKKNAYSIRSL